MITDNAPHPVYCLWRLEKDGLMVQMKYSLLTYYEADENGKCTTPTLMTEGGVHAWVIHLSCSSDARRDTSWYKPHVAMQSRSPYVPDTESHECFVFSCPFPPSLTIFPHYTPPPLPPFPLIRRWHNASLAPTWHFCHFPLRTSPNEHVIDSPSSRQLDVLAGNFHLPPERHMFWTNMRMFHHLLTAACSSEKTPPCSLHTVDILDMSCAFPAGTHCWINFGGHNVESTLFQYQVPWRCIIPTSFTPSSIYTIAPA